jgi:hypothetical protein
LGKARGPASQYRRNAGPTFNHKEILVITTLLLIACVVGLLAAKPWVFMVGAVVLLLMHPFALLLALALVGGGAALFLTSWGRMLRYALGQLRDRRSAQRALEGRSRTSSPAFGDE